MSSCNFSCGVLEFLENTDLGNSFTQVIALFKEGITPKRPLVPRAVQGEPVTVAAQRCRRGWGRMAGSSHLTDHPWGGDPDTCMELAVSAQAWAPTFHIATASSKAGLELKADMQVLL